MKKILTLIFCMVVGITAVYAQDSAATQQLNKKNLLVKEWNTNANGTKVIDHVTIYSPEGKKIEETEYDSYGKQKWRKRYEWSASGKMARELVYDERNRLVDYKKFEYNEFGKKKTQYTYDAKNKLISTKVYEYITQDE